MYVPIQRPLLLESVASNPEATDLEKAQAFAEVIRQAVMQAHLQNAGEIYFFATDPDMEKVATHSKIWEKLPWPAYRLKISSLEPSGK